MKIMYSLQDEFPTINTSSFQTYDLKKTPWKMDSQISLSNFSSFDYLQVFWQNSHGN